MTTTHITPTVHRPVRYTALLTEPYDLQKPWTWPTGTRPTATLVTVGDDGVALESTPYFLDADYAESAWERQHLTPEQRLARLRKLRKAERVQWKKTDPAGYRRYWAEGMRSAILNEWHHAETRVKAQSIHEQMLFARHNVAKYKRQLAKVERYC